MNIPYVAQFNPAAVQGYALPGISSLDATASVPGPGLEFQAYRGNANSGGMRIDIEVRNPAFRALLEACPLFAPALRWSPQYGGHLHADKVPYAQVLALMGQLYARGVRFDSELANQQALGALQGVPPACQQAYARFLRDADAFLQLVRLLNIQALATGKGLRNVEHPFRARALMHGGSAVLVTPDPYDSRFVQVTVRSAIWRQDLLQLRETAYSHYESLGQRVQLTET